MITNHPMGLLKRLALTAVAVIGLGTTALPPTPASAYVVVGAAAPVYRPYHNVYYYNRPYYHWHGYYRPYYRPYYRSYYYRPYRPYYRPYYYPRAAYRACPYGLRWVGGHWNRWHAWVPAGCR